jgi:acyl carrier protein
MDELRLKGVVASVLGVPVDSIGDDTNADTVKDWTSIVQLSLILALEDEFGIEIPDDEAADMTSYPLIRLIVAEQVGASPDDGQ